MNNQILIAAFRLTVLAAAAVFHSATAHADSTPSNCTQLEEKLALTPHRLVLVRLCHDLEANHMRATAKRTGAPTPSASVVRLPDYGTELSVSAGLACMGGRAMRRLPNGWEQLVDASGSWQRCEALE